jgi:hypothetical protein
MSDLPKDERIGARWLDSCPANEDESTLWSVVAHRRMSRMRLATGKLFLTSARIVFCPNRLDSLVVGGSWAVERDKVRSISAQRPHAKFTLGLSMPSISVFADDDSTEQFIVYAPQKLAERLHRELFFVSAPDSPVG